MQENLLIQLESAISQLSKSQRMVANYILQNPIVATYSTIERMAHEVGVSTTTIVRLSNSMGYSGYAEFQKELQELLKKRSDPATKLEISMRSDGMNDTTLIDILKEQAENINLTSDNLSDKLFFDAERILTGANRIFTFGSRSCFGVAHYLSYDLNRIYGNSMLLTDEGGMLPERIAGFGKNDVLLAITLPRYVKSVVQATIIAKQKGASIIAITDSYLSPLADHADVLFLVSSKSRGFHNALTSTMFIADALIGICTLHNPTKVKQQLLEVKSITKALGVHDYD